MRDQELVGNSTAAGATDESPSSARAAARQIFAQRQIGSLVVFAGWRPSQLDCGIQVDFVAGQDLRVNSRGPDS